MASPIVSVGYRTLVYMDHWSVPAEHIYSSFGNREDEKTNKEDLEREMIGRKTEENLRELLVSPQPF